MSVKKKKRIPIKYNKHRVCLSDILPYEAPLIFSNWNFYEFLLDEPKNNINENVKKLLINNNQRTKPFQFNIIHKAHEYRTLSVIHPFSQMDIIDFYDKYKELIIYFCSKSNFSIRKPHSIAKMIIYNDKYHKKNQTKDDGIIEIDNEETRKIRSFFVNKKYTNIYKFYDSYEFLRAEKKYDYLFKMDISKCFDSIYTHSIEWAIWGKDNIKKYLSHKEEYKNFASDFDKIMQNMNYGETNGIIIGSEFSRIFAEVILQEIDFRVENDLKEQHFYHKKEYQVFRYVDDYFIFYNDENLKEKIVTLFSEKLKEFKLFLGQEKSVLYDKPIITNITIAKNKISDTLNDKIKHSIEPAKVDVSDNDQEAKVEKVQPATFSIKINSNKIITEVKSIIKSSVIEYKDILNYTFAILRRRTNIIISALKKYKKEEGNYSDEKIIDAFIAIIEISFFLYAVSPRINITIKLCDIINNIITFTRHNCTNKSLKNKVSKKIYDEICHILKKFKNEKLIQTETLYLLILLQQMGNDYALSPDLLKEYLGIKKDIDNDKLFFSFPLNYFSITVILFYIKNNEKYKDIKELIEKEILNKIPDDYINHKVYDTEITLMLFDVIACPYITDDFRKDIIKKIGINNRPNRPLLNDFLDFVKNRNWFIQWDNFNFKKELDNKKSLDVY